MERSGDRDRHAPANLPHTTSVPPCMPQTLVADDYIPVVASVASNGAGQALNVNADTAAGEVGQPDPRSS